MHGPTKSAAQSTGFLAFFPERYGTLSPNFKCLLYVSIYAGLQNFQLPATLTKLCHIKCDRHRNAQNVHHRPKRTLAGCTQYGVTLSQKGVIE